LAARIVERWNPSDAASLIEITHPDDYDTAGWVFSSYSEHSRAWVEQVGKNTRWEVISDRLREIRTGDLDAVFQCERLLLQLSIPLRRSMVKRLTSAMAGLMRNARLPDLHVGISMHPFRRMLFPEDVQQVLEQLRASDIAEDLSRSRPRDWRALIGLTGLTGEFGDPFFAEMIDLLDPEALLATVENQVVGHEYELRCLLWLLTRGCSERRQLLASRLYPTVLAACQRSKVERMPMLRAFMELDANLGERMLAETGTDPASLVRDTEEQEEQEETRDRGDIIQQLRERAATFEAVNKDYIIDLNNWQLVELGEN
jgi:hypothetical protein